MKPAPALSLEEPFCLFFSHLFHSQHRMKSWVCYRFNVCHMYSKCLGNCGICDIFTTVNMKIMFTIAETSHIQCTTFA